MHQNISRMELGSSKSSHMHFLEANTSNLDSAISSQSHLIPATSRLVVYTQKS